MADRTKEYFVAVDAMNVENVSRLFTEDARFRFGNADPAVGRQGIRKALEDFYSAIKSLRHEIKARWERDDAAIAELEITYTRHDDSAVTLPSTTILRREGDLARDVRIYMDISPLFA